MKAQSLHSITKDTLQTYNNPIKKLYQLSGNVYLYSVCNQGVKSLYTLSTVRNTCPIIFRYYPYPI